MGAGWNRSSARTQRQTRQRRREALAAAKIFKVFMLGCALGSVNRVGRGRKPFPLLVLSPAFWSPALAPHHWLTGIGEQTDPKATPKFEQL